MNAENSNSNSSRTLLIVAALLLVGAVVAIIAVSGSGSDDDGDSDTVADTGSDVQDAAVSDDDDAPADDADADAPDREAAVSDTAETYTWEEYGVSFTLPESWQGSIGGQDHNVALVSPEAAASGTGSFVTLRGLSHVGDDAALASALEPLAADLDAAVEPVTVGGIEGYGITQDLDDGGTQWLMLVPYGDQGGAIYLTAVAAEGEAETLTGILDSMSIDIPAPDYAAMDAAWQTSLADAGRLLYGDEAAPIQMVEFLSMTCGHCANYSRDVSRMAALDVETGRVQLEVALIAGDPYATYASHATLCAAEQGQGYSAYTALFQGYFEDGPQAAYTEDGAAERLAALGLDMDALNACVADETYADALDAMRTRFYDNGLTGTPTVLLATGDDDPQPMVLPDGQVWSGAIPMELLRGVFDLLQEGVPLDEVFENL